MLKKILITATIAFSTPSIYAQEQIINWGEESKNEITHHSFVRGAQNDFIKLGFEKKNSTILPQISRFDGALKEVASSDITASEKGMKFDDFLSVKGNLHFFSNLYDSKTKSTTFYCQPYDIKTLKTKGNSIDLGTFGAIKKKSQSSSAYILSQDSTQILMFGLSPYSKNDNEKYYIGVYNEVMQKQWESTVELPFKDKFVKILSTIVTNNGSVGILIKNYDKNTDEEYIKENKTKVPSYSVKLLLYSKNSKTPQEFTFDTGKFISSLSLVTEDNNQIELFGLCGNLPNDLITGFFTAKIDKTSYKVTASQISDFPESLFKQLKIDDQGEDGKEPGLSADFRFCDYIKRENGSKDYFLQFYNSALVRTSSSYTTIYTYGDIIDINCNTEGKIAINRIPLNFKSSMTKIFGGFQVLTKNNSLYLMYIDNEKNLNQEINKKPNAPGMFSKIMLVSAKLDEKNILTREPFFRLRLGDFLVAPNASFRMSDTKLALYSTKFNLLTFGASKDKIGTLELK